MNMTCLNAQQPGPGELPSGGLNAVSVGFAQKRHVPGPQRDAVAARVFGGVQGMVGQLNQSFMLATSGVSTASPKLLVTRSPSTERAPAPA